MLKKYTISIIAAIGKNRELGKDNKLLWHIPEDLPRFKRLTQNHAVIMGRKTFESIGKPLPNRLNIVITRDIKNLVDSVTHEQLFPLRGSADNTPQSASRGSPSHFITPTNFSSGKIVFASSNLVVCSSLESAIDYAKELITNNQSPITNNEIFIIGGAQIYEQGIKYADRLYLTLVDKNSEADAFFPDYQKFSKIISKESCVQNDLQYSWVILEEP